MELTVYRVNANDLIPVAIFTAPDTDIAGSQVYRLIEQEDIDESQTAFYIIVSGELFFWCSLPDGFHWHPTK
jgi:hypothetical protein